MPRLAYPSRTRGPLSVLKTQDGRRVGEGGSAIDPTIGSQLLGRRSDDNPIAALTPRGDSNLEGIAEKLVITVRAVEKHVSRIFDKLGLPSTGGESRRVLAVLTFLRS